MHIIDEKNSTLKDTSYDEDNKVYMVDCELGVCSFDDVKKWYVKNRTPLAKPNPKSNDALFFDKEEGFDRQKVEVTASKHRDLLFSTVKKLANDELIKFGLDQFRNYLFKNVHTYTVKEFEENFINKYYVKE
ncbi:MAG: hypothetical protein IJF03_01550 [Lachnospiraceae bacterium]|nr:hypothetical protein [Lachnospiraceae bacterium]